jgi:teichuronic acid exporter
MTSLTQKTTSGLSWSALESFANQGLSFVIQIVLARLIAPSEFGLLALLAIFIMFSQAIIDGGFTQAIVQKKSVTRTDTSTVFYFNLLISVLMYAFIFCVAPAIAGYFEEPRLTLLVRVLGLNLIVSAIGKMQHSLLIRGLEFRKLFKIRTPAIVIGGFVGIVMALLGFEVWALVFSQITTALFSSVCFWYFSDRAMSPNWQFSFASLKELGRFGAGILGASLFYQGTQNIYGLVIGKVFAFDQLGFYNRARTFHRTPAIGLTQVLNRVLFPVFSTIQDDRPRICKALRRGIPIISFVLFPLMAFLMCAADSIVVVLLTEKWLPSATYMRWFPIIGMIYPIAAVQLSVVRAIGHSGLFFLMDVVKNTLAIVVLFVTLKHGVLAVVIGQVGVAVVTNLLINLPVCHVVIGYKVKDQVADFLPYLICVAIAALPSLSVDFWAGTESHLVVLVLKGVIFATTYLAMCYVTRLKAMAEVGSKARFLIQRYSRTNFLFNRRLTNSESDGS